MKAIALISGGLDSTLAAKVTADLGVTVIGVHFSHPFCAREQKAEQALLDLARDLSRQAGIELRVVRLGEEFMRVVACPEHGYGSNVNPCIDCRILMLKKAREMMEAEGASFLVTGEVVAQRPMSQQRQTMRRIDAAAGVEGIVVRPLSAGILEETVPEREGWIDRGRLHSFSGRSRKPQIDLAVMLGIIDFPNAAGGCLLTDPRFSERVKDLMRHDGFTLDNVELLKLGRHFRISAGAKLVVGRNEAENARMEVLAGNSDVILVPPSDVAGPTALIRGAGGEDDLRLAAMIVCRYCDRAGQGTLEIAWRRHPGKEWSLIAAAPLTEAEVEKIRI